MEEPGEAGKDLCHQLAWAGNGGMTEDTQSCGVACIYLYFDLQVNGWNWRTSS
jgi:hypothetical protein